MSSAGWSVAIRPSDQPSLATPLLGYGFSGCPSWRFQDALASSDIVGNAMHCVRNKNEVLSLSIYIYTYFFESAGPKDASDNKDLAPLVKWPVSSGLLDR